MKKETAKLSRKRILQDNSLAKWGASANTIYVTVAPQYEGAVKFAGRGLAGTVYVKTSRRPKKYSIRNAISESINKIFSQETEDIDRLVSAYKK